MHFSSGFSYLNQHCNQLNSFWREVIKTNEIIIMATVGNILNTRKYLQYKCPRNYIEL